jgi:hypothetical protein
MWHFKGLALLGAESPACPNLTPLSFADQDTDVDIPVLMLADEGPNPNPGGTLPPPHQGEIVETTPAELEAANKRAAELETKNQLLETQLADQKKANDTALIQNRIDGLVKDKKITPAEAKVLLPVALALETEDATVKLGDNSSVAPREALFRVLVGLKSHGLDLTTRIPGNLSEEDVELASRKGTKAFDNAVQGYMKAGKTKREALSMAAKDFADEPEGGE